MKTKTKLVFVLVMIATLIISLAVYKIQKMTLRIIFRM